VGNHTALTESITEAFQTSKFGTVNRRFEALVRTLHPYFYDRPRGVSSKKTFQFFDFIGPYLFDVLIMNTNKLNEDWLFDESEIPSETYEQLARDRDFKKIREGFFNVRYFTKFLQNSVISSSITTLLLFT
jgi:hypothetical protein